MARYYRRRFRRPGRYRRRFFKKRFGVGGGNRKRPSSYSVAYGFTKQFDKLLSKYAAVMAANEQAMYTSPTSLSSLARIFFSDIITDSDARFVNTIVAGPGYTPSQVRDAMLAFYTGVCINHTDEMAPLTRYFASRLLVAPQAPLAAAAVSATNSSIFNTISVPPSPIQVPSSSSSSTSNPPPQQPPPPPQIQQPPQAPAAPDFVPYNPFDDAADYSTLLQALKTQFKDSLQRCTKRNLPISLAVSSWAHSFLKHKKKRKGLLKFWKWRSVPRFMILLTMTTIGIWCQTKYGAALESMLHEIDFVRNQISNARLLQLAQAGIPEAQAALAASININNAIPGQTLFAVGEQIDKVI